MPHVGEYLAADILELIQVPNANAIVGDGDTSDFTKRIRVEKPQLLGAIAEDEPLAILGQTPAFARIPERSTWREGREVVDECNVGLPRQLHELPVPFGQALGKMRAGNTVLLNDLAGFKPDFSQSRLALESSAFEEEPVTVDQALRIRRRVVRIGIHHPEGVNTWRPLSLEISDAAVCAPDVRTNEGKHKQAARCAPSRIGGATAIPNVSHAGLSLSQGLTAFADVRRLIGTEGSEGMGRWRRFAVGCPGDLDDARAPRIGRHTLTEQGHRVSPGNDES